MSDADITKRFPQKPVASALGIESMEDEFTTAPKAMETSGTGRPSRGTVIT